MEKFIYAFNAEDRDLLLCLGFTLLKRDEDSGIYVFANETSMNFTLDSKRFVKQNTMSF